MNPTLDEYVKNIIDAGYTIEQYKKVSNPCVNFALDYADIILETAIKEGTASVENISIEIEGKWQFLYINQDEAGFNAWVAALESLIKERFESYLNIAE